MIKSFFIQSRNHQSGFAFWENLFLVAGLLSLGIFGVLQVHSYIFQEYDHWSYDQILKGKPHSIRIFLSDLLSSSSTTPSSEMKLPSPFQMPSQPTLPYNPEHRVPLGRLQIPAVGLSVTVLEGTDHWTLNRAVGHIPGTTLPGCLGNVAIAGHRDRFFRCLRKISKNDQIILSTPGGTFHYSVESIRIVSPSNAEALNSTEEPVLTLVTCYPFYFFGSAPQRFIVKARLDGPSKG